MISQAIKPWYQVAVPREDLRRGIPLDASAFAIHLDQVIDGRAPKDYRDPERFFARTYLTESYLKMTSEILRRLAGDMLGTSPGFNLTTQFGGGKTHFLTLLYHLCRGGEAAKGWQGVSDILAKARLSTIPRARVAVFIGNRFDFLVGVGQDGEPRRRTPWGDLAWQLGGPTLYELVKEHDEQGIVPGGEILQKVLADKPTLILMDEVLSFIRRAREAGKPYNGLASKFYSFMDVLTREIVGTTHVALVISLPLSEYEMTQEDESDFQRLSKLLNRLSKEVLLSEKMEIAEITRRRLFEQIGNQEEIHNTAIHYANWARQNRHQLPEWFPVENATEIFEATYPFHPTVLSVFERKWQSLPRFQRTRGILRLLALWVMNIWQRAYKESTEDLLITLGTAPLDDPLFRATVFEQLGEPRLEAAILADIAGNESHAVRLDSEDTETVKRIRLHQKVASTVFFESCGGQVRNEASLSDIRLAAGGPDTELGLIEQALSNLVNRCYYLDARGTTYWISHRPTLNKIISDRRASLSGPEAEERIREKVHQVIRDTFKAGPPLERRYFPETSGDIPDTPSLILVIMSPKYSWEDASRDTTRQCIMDMIQNYGSRGRTYKSGLIFIVAEGGSPLYDEARTLLALETLEDPLEQERLRLENGQIRELRETKARTEKRLRDLVWRVYRLILFLGEQGDLQEVDLGILHPSASESMVNLILSRLKQEAVLEDYVSPDFLVRNWPPALEDWSTKAVRDMFFASPKFPRLQNPEGLRKTIQEGVQKGKFGYIGKIYGEYQGKPLIESSEFKIEDVEISEEVVLLRRDKALEMLQETSSLVVSEKEERKQEDEGIESFSQWKTELLDVSSQMLEKPPKTVKRSLSWNGEIPHQKWTQFYMKVLTRFAANQTLRLQLHFEVSSEEGISQIQVDEIRMALRELGLDESNIRIEE